MPDRRLGRILIVDDEQAQMQALCATLRDNGYDTVGVCTGAMALDVLQRDRFDLMLADLMMPGMDGIALLHDALRLDPDLVGVIMTGEGTIATAVEAMKVGAIDYILKPFRLSVILPVLSRALIVRHLRMENAKLALSVRARTEELEKANRDLEAFSDSVSHDLRAPLTIITGYTDILLHSYGSGLPADAREALGMVEKGTQRMVRLIDDLLRLSRLGRQALSKTPVNVADLVHETLEDLRRAHGGGNVDIRIGELPECVGDPALLRQVFVNLLSNAFKFSRIREKPVIEIDGRLEEDERIYCIRDNGAGFDMRFAKELFGAFKRLHSDAQFEGTGVGLSIVHRIIERHGGRIWAEAALDQGATFYFSLPE
ncbi:MAG: response regulator [Proteobacteria bacterium]|nr:response regulator [Pseudomonadota bacterium]